MGQSTDGNICFGIICEEGYEFPWDDEQFDGDIEEWWRAYNGFTDDHNPWTPEGEYAEGWAPEDARFEEYYEKRGAWIKENPVPVELVNYCSEDYPIYILAVPGTQLTCGRGFPTTFDPYGLSTYDAQIEALIRFTEEHNIEVMASPAWQLSSYWG